jgi:putative ABC transport system permease protein
VAAEDGTSVSGMITSQYELIHGRWPLKPEEIVFVLPYSNRVADITLYSLGLKDKGDLNLMMDQLYRGEALTLEVDEPTFTYDDFMNLELKVIMPGERYRRSEGGTLWVDLTETPGGRSFLYDSKDVGLKLKVVGIIRAGKMHRIAYRGALRICRA